MAFGAPDFHNTYAGYDAHIQRADAARYLILKRIDAVDADPDLICLRPLTEHRKRKSLLMGSQRAVRQSALKLGGGVCNAFMDAAPGHPLWTGIERDLARASCAHVWHATGPRFLTGDPQPDVAKNSQNATLIPSR
ncbi:MAG: hypothetical protein R3F11_00480 [Verrucomicrobiales bacterium]